MLTETEEKHDCELVMMVGLPYSGKSTTAKRLATPIVCPDAIRLALHGQRFIGEAEPFVWAIAKTMVRALFLAGHKRVVLDATNITKKRRSEWISKSWKRSFMVTTASRQECEERAKANGDTEILPVIAKMAEEWENLDDDERPVYVTIE